MEPSWAAHDARRYCALEGAVVLAVDDRPANVLLLQRLLTQAGAKQVEGVTDPRQAIAAYQKVQPDLILLDLHMPHMDGMAVLDEFNALRPDDSFLPVIVLTADATIEAKNRALGAGANDFLTKPFEHTEVLLRVNNLLRTRALHEQMRLHNQKLRDEICQREQLERRQFTERAERLGRLERVLDDRSHELTMVFQPITDLSSKRLAGYEALARFRGEPPRPPNEWFAEAADLGLGIELELCAVEAALAQLDRLPDGTYLSVNVSPQTAIDPLLVSAIESNAERIVIEITEHAAVTEYETLTDRLAELRRLGARIAVDDAGAGYASLQHILRIAPDIIKLDIALTRNVHADPARRALANSLVTFSHDIGADITAEGIEHPQELDTLRRIGAKCGQGYLIGRPAPLPLVR